jgi:hypothetical protein
VGRGQRFNINIILKHPIMSARGHKIGVLFLWSTTTKFGNWIVLGIDDFLLKAIITREFSHIDSKVFYSVPTSFFVIDNRIPRIIRELITESEGCLKMNYLTGASACMRKAIYELLVIEKAEGEDYEGKIKFLKKKYPESDPNLFDILSHIQDMTSDKIHEQSWDRWDSKYLKLIIETLKTVLYDIYVIPKIKADRSKLIQEMRADLKKDKKRKTNEKGGEIE